MAAFMRVCSWLLAALAVSGSLLLPLIQGQEVCPPLSLSPHVIPSTTDISISTHVSFSCEPGYRLVGNYILTCMVTAVWNHPPPTCEEILRCPALPASQHLHFNSTDNSVGAVVRAWCDTGYWLRGETVITCSIAGWWSYSPLSCGNVTCYSFNDDPSESTALITDEQPHTRYIYGTVLTYSCEKGYRLVGPSSVTCTANGTWSNRYRPYCALGVLCPAVDLVHGNVSDGYDLQHPAPSTAVTVSCDHGYGPIRGIATISCERVALLESRWFPYTPTCKRLCPRVELGRNLYTQPAYQVFPGTVLNFTCQDNYILHGDTSSRCVNGSWTTPFPTCTEYMTVECPYPLPRDYLSVATSNGTQVGSVAEFSCEQGWYLVGSARIVCQPQGYWSAPVPYCSPKGSESPTKPQIVTFREEHVSGGSGAVVLIGAVVGGVIGVVILIAVVVVVTLVIVIVLVKYTDCIGKPRYRRFEVTLRNDDQPLDKIASL